VENGIFITIAVELGARWERPDLQAFARQKKCRPQFEGSKIRQAFSAKSAC